MTDRCDGQNVWSANSTSLDWQALWDAVQIRDDYETSRRALGVYPLTSIFAGLGIASLQREIYESYERPLTEIPVEGRLKRYALAPANDASASAQSNADMLDSLDWN
ncbi:MAG: hypothetical protein NWQ45_03780, partial [Congregibacter sp.]|nr:hypothetical protein [Congregibacter sp.]